MRPSKAWLFIILVLLAFSVMGEEQVAFDLSTINHPDPIITVTYNNVVSIVPEATKLTRITGGEREIPLDIINTCEPAEQCRTWNLKPGEPLEPGDYIITVSSERSYGDETVGGVNELRFGVSGLSIQVAAPPNLPGPHGNDNDVYFESEGTGFSDTRPFTLVLRTMYENPKGPYFIGGVGYNRSNADCYYYLGVLPPPDNSGFYDLDSLNKMNNDLRADDLIGDKSVDIGSLHTADLTTSATTISVVCREYKIADANGDGDTDDPEDYVKARDTAAVFEAGYYGSGPEIILTTTPEFVGDSDSPFAVINANMNQPGFCKISDGSNEIPFSSQYDYTISDYDRYENQPSHILCYKHSSSCPKGEYDILDKNIQDTNTHEFHYTITCNNKALLESQNISSVVVDFDIPFTIIKELPLGVRINGSDSGLIGVVYLNVSTKEGSLEVPSICFVNDLNNPGSSQNMEDISGWIHGLALNTYDYDVIKVNYTVVCNGVNTDNHAEKNISFIIDTKPPGPPKIELVNDSSGNAVVCNGESSIRISPYDSDIPENISAPPSSTDYYDYDHYDYKIVDDKNNVIDQGSVSAGDPSAPLIVTASLGAYNGSASWMVRVVDTVGNVGDWSEKTVDIEPSSSDICDPGEFIKYYAPPYGWFLTSDDNKEVDIASKRPADCRFISKEFFDNHPETDFESFNRMQVIGSTETGGQIHKLIEELQSDVEYHVACKEPDGTLHEREMDFGIYSDNLKISSITANPSLVKDLSNKHSTINATTNHDARCMITGNGLNNEYFDGEGSDLVDSFKKHHSKTLDFSDDSLSGETSHTFTVYCIDKAGESDSNSVTVIVQFDTPFTITVLQPSQNSYLKSGDMTVVVATDVTATCYYSQGQSCTDSSCINELMNDDGGEWSANFYGLDAGPHDVLIKCTDAQPKSVTVPVHFTVDLEDPTLSFGNASDLCQPLGKLLSFVADDDVMVNYTSLSLSWPDDNITFVNTTGENIVIDSKGHDTGEVIVDGVVYDMSGRSGMASVSFNILPEDDYNCHEHCGNGFIDSDEDCDGSNLGGVTCEDLGYSGGILECDNSCHFNEEACLGDRLPNCGDGIINFDEGEQCDGTPPENVSCETLGFKSGTLSCENCLLNTDDCVPFGIGECGNGVLEPGEECDTEVPESISCESIGYTRGSISCSDSCVLDTSNCEGELGVCGDNKLNTGEICDTTTNLSCEDLGLEGDEITCTNSCSLNTSLCYKSPVCGNKILEHGEQCDGTPEIVDCSEYKDSLEGIISCNHCLLDTSGCSQTDNCPIICIPDGNCDKDCATTDGCSADPDCQSPEPDECPYDCIDDGYCESGCSFNDNCSEDPDCQKPTPDNKKFNWWSIILMVLGLCLMGGGGYYLYYNYEERLEQELASRNISFQNRPSSRSVLSPEERTKMLEELRQKREAQKEAFQRHIIEKENKRKELFKAFGDENQKPPYGIVSESSGSSSDNERSDSSVKEPKRLAGHEDFITLDQLGKKLIDDEKSGDGSESNEKNVKLSSEKSENDSDAFDDLDELIGDS